MSILKALSRVHVFAAIFVSTFGTLSKAELYNPTPYVDTDAVDAFFKLSPFLRVCAVVAFLENFAVFLLVLFYGCFLDARKLVKKEVGVLVFCGLQGVLCLVIPAMVYLYLMWYFNDARGGMSPTWITLDVCCSIYGRCVIRTSALVAVSLIGYTTVRLRHYSSVSVKIQVFCALLTQLLAAPLAFLIYLFYTERYSAPAIVFVFSSFTFVITVVVKMHNNEIYKHRLSGNLSLNERYQIVQNKRMLRHVFNFVIICQVIEVVDVVGRFTEFLLQIDTTHSVALKIGVPFPYLIILLLPLMKKNDFLSRFSRSNRVFSIFRMEPETVVDKTTAHNHFEQLGKLWQ